MTQPKQFIVACSVFIPLYCLIFISGCSDGKTSGKKKTRVITEISDTTLLFNGKSLDGWDITNFGPQGPVYVSGGEIKKSLLVDNWLMGRSNGGLHGIPPQQSGISVYKEWNSDTL